MVFSASPSIKLSEMFRLNRSASISGTAAKASSRSSSVKTPADRNISSYGITERAIEATPTLLTGVEAPLEFGFDELHLPVRFEGQ